MNTLRNPNFVRLGLPFLLVAAMAGSAACGKSTEAKPALGAVAAPANATPTASAESSPPTVDPSSTALLGSSEDGGPVGDKPMCAVDATDLSGRTESFDVIANFKPVENIVYDFGDGTTDAHGKQHGETHTYTKDGDFTVHVQVNGVECAQTEVVLN